MKNIIIFAFCAFALVQSVSAQEKNNDKVYTTFGGNGGILSFSDVKDNGTKVNSIPRFTFFFNIGTNYNYDVSDHFGFFSGTNIKNIGMITEVGDTKLKRRVYTLGVPVGFKVGNVKDGIMLFGGAEVDVAFNYKEKTFVNDDKKSKFNEWFSDRTQTLMPSVFAGFQFSEHFSIKGKPGTMAGAIPAFLGCIPVDNTFNMRTGRIQGMQLSLLIFIKGKSMSLVLYNFTFPGRQLNKAFNFFF